MKLLRLTLNNFQGIKSLTLEFNGSSASVYGDNATGKTTVYNALTWLLFDKASTGVKNFTPKTRGSDDDPVATVDVPNAFDLSNLSDEELEQLDSLMGKLSE